MKGEGFRGVYYRGMLRTHIFSVNKNIVILTVAYEYSTGIILNYCKAKLSNLISKSSLEVIFHTMLLLTNCEVHTGKYLDLQARVQIFSRMDRTNWSIRALLYSHNEH